jgi:hypothetical protein
MRRLRRKNAPCARPRGESAFIGFNLNVTPDDTKGSTQIVEFEWIFCG